MNDPNLIKMIHDCDETGSWKHPKPDEECFPLCFTAVLPRLMKDGKDRSDRSEKHEGSSGFLLVPAEMLSERQNSGKCLLLTMVSFKDGLLTFLALWMIVVRNGWKSPRLFLRDPNFSVMAILFVVVCFSCHLIVVVFFSSHWKHALFTVNHY